MPTKCVDVFNASGAKLFSYSIAVEDEGCLDAEFEELALILAEVSGAVAVEEVAHLRACCDARNAVASKEMREAVRPKRRRNAVVSLVKHRMKRASARPVQQRIHQVS